MEKKNKTIIVMPAYNAEATVKKTFEDVPLDCYDEILLVDDCSVDNTCDLAESLGITVIRHDENLGYGGNQKTCYNEALKRGADIVVMLHPDHQYDGRLVPFMKGFLEMNICDVIFGSRIRTRREALEGGMPLYKYIGNRILTLIENIVLGQNLTETHTGFRAYTRRVLETIPYNENSNDFVFDSEFLIQSVYFDFRIGDVPVPVRYMPEASSINFKRSVKYGLQTLNTLRKYILQKAAIQHYPIFKGHNHQVAELVTTFQS